jgi:dTDP-glucose 4,6-dehydratase
VTFIQGDIRRFSLVGLGHFDLIVHAATPARATLNNNSPKEMLSIIIDGQRNLIEQAAHSRCPRILFTSSGAVYGPQPADVTRLEESQLLGPDPMKPLTAYHEGKRMSELLLAIATREGVLEAVTARLFAFVGPYLPLNEHFAIGNFIRDGLSGGPIIIKGDGRTVRSYQYPTDMVSWLWTLATRGQPGRAYNVGSDHALSMREIAQQVSGATDGAEVHILGKIDPGVPVDRYVPSIERSKGELELSNKIDFQEAVRRTVAWHRRPTP